MAARAPLLVALLRGINVGGHNKVPMARLRATITQLGFRDVRTYIQSGNVVFAGASTGAEAKVEHAIADAFGFPVPVIVRPATALANAEPQCPFADAAIERPNLVHIGFAKQKFARTAATATADYCRNGERVAVRGQCIWVDYAGGVARSKLTPAVLDRAFGSSVTMRNIKTLRAIVAMLSVVRPK